MVAYALESTADDDTSWGDDTRVFATGVRTRLDTLEATWTSDLILYPGTNITVDKTGSTWPARPTTRTDVTVRWRGADPSPAVVSSGTAGMYAVDEREIPAT